MLETATPTINVPPPAPAIPAFPGKLAISPKEFARATGTGRKTACASRGSGEIPHRRQLGGRIPIPLRALNECRGSSP